MTETNLEHYKKELGKIFYEGSFNPAAMFAKIKTKYDPDIRSSYGQSYADDILDWMAKPYKEPILDDAERKYLAAVILPFRKEVDTISKFQNWNNTQQYIYISLKSQNYCTLPFFTKSTMYKGMECGKHYSLEELGL
jgi:hypothetical protein